MSDAVSKRKIPIFVIDLVSDAASKRKPLIIHSAGAGAKFDPRFQRVFNARCVRISKPVVRGIAQKLVLALEPLK